MNDTHSIIDEDQLSSAMQKKLVDRMKIIQSMSEIYSSVYYIDMASGTFSEVSSWSVVHAHIGSSGNAQERLNYF
ncbi:MAG: hypothetical protein ACI4P0_04285, partial [Mailhella sp.]